MDSSSRSRRSPSCTSRDKFLRKILAPAIAGKSCPICLDPIDDRRAVVLTACHHAYCTHCIRKWSSFRRSCPLCNANFDSWFFRIRLSPGSFLEEQLRPLGGSRTTNRESEGTVIRRLRDELSSISGRSRPLPWRRSFGRPGCVHPDVVAERALQWRASIYSRRLQAAPISSQYCLDQIILEDNGVRERVLQRIEPWIQRELQAILGDPDPSIIVHVATSLFLSNLERKSSIPSEHCSSEREYFTQLRPFLNEWTDMFWHELRCFAESRFTIETYDAVVEYRRLE